MYHPFADLIGLKVVYPTADNNYSRCSLEVTEKLLNPHKVVHGAVLYALADTGMGAIAVNLRKFTTSFRA